MGSILTVLTSNGMKHSMLNTKGKKAGEVQLPDQVFDVPWNPDLVHQSFVIAKSNRRQVSAKTKGRGEVRGGGRKPWRQKGTGRARHGSTRSPIWIGGGVAHGPTGLQNYKKKLNQKMRKSALRSLLSEMLRKKQIVVVDALDREISKTKDVAKVVEQLSLGKKNTLLVLPALDQNIIRASRNIPYLKTVQAKELNVADVGDAALVIVPKASLPILEKALGN